MYAPHVLPAASDYDALYRAFRWRVPAHYNIGVDVCDRWAEIEPGRIAIFHVGAGGAVEEISYGWLRETSNRLANALAGAWHRARRSGRDPAAAGAGGGREPHRDLQARRDRAAARDPVRDRGDLLSAAEFRREGADHQRPGAGEACRCPRRSARPRTGSVDRRTGDGRRGFPCGARARVRRFHAGRHHARRSRADDLHLRHDRPAQRRAARPSRAARSSAGHRDAARISPAAGRPVLDAGGLGLGRRPARLPAAAPALRRAGGGAEVREVRSRGGLRADGEDGRAQRLHPADRAAHAALGAADAAGTTSACARSARAARRSAPRPTNGASRRSASPSTSSTARPNAIWCWRRARRSACRAPARSASRCPATRSR